MENSRSTSWESHGHSNCWILKKHFGQKLINQRNGADIRELKVNNCVFGGQGEPFGSECVQELSEK